MKIVNLIKNINLTGIIVLCLVGTGLILNIDLNPLFYVIATIIGLGLLFKSEEVKKANNPLSKLFIVFVQGLSLFMGLAMVLGLFLGSMYFFEFLFNTTEGVIVGNIPIKKLIFFLLALLGPPLILILVFTGWKGLKEFFKPED